MHAVAFRFLQKKMAALRLIAEKWPVVCLGVEGKTLRLALSGTGTANG
jgi:hypothetical protein